ncbi:MAG: hypothetical protein U9O83_02650 [Campylobacterota bacterium]|nr:hypothetical protein [Campylobacterota bacterium]
MRYNRLELLLAIDEYYDEKFQPYKDDGLYIYGATTFVLYKTRWSQKKMMEFISKAVKHEIEVQNLSEDYIYSDEHQQYPYRWYKDLTCGYRKVVHFDFIHVTYGREEELIPFLQDATCYTTNEIRTTSFAYTDDEVVHNVKDSKDIFYADDQRLEVEKLTRIATWEHNPNDFFNGFEIDSFSKEYFGNVSTPKGIDTKFRKLSMIHHPDKGGNELMFKALSNARRYLKNTKLNSPKAKSIT